MVPVDAEAHFEGGLIGRLEATAALGPPPPPRWRRQVRRAGAWCLDKVAAWGLIEAVKSIFDTLFSRLVERGPSSKLTQA